MPESALVWQERSLGSLATYLNGYAFKPRHWGTEGLPIVRIRELLDASVEPDRYPGNAADAFKIDDGDLIFSWSATLAALIWKRGPALLNQHLFKVSPAADVDRDFLGHLLNAHLDALAARSHGTTMKHITRRDLASYSVLLPPLGEQQRIAEILNSVDTAIETASMLIGKAEITKQGLVDALVERAESDVSAGLRGASSPTIGQLIREHGGLIQTGPFGSQLHAHDYVEEGVPVVMPQDILAGRIDLGQAARIPESTAGVLARHRMRVGDVVFSRRGDLSRCAAITVREVGWLCGTGCLLVRPPAKVLRATWLALAYRHDIGQRYVRAHAVGSTMPNLNTSILSGLAIPVPSLDEQDRAIALVGNHESKTQLEVATHAKLLRIKKGLQAGLLSGTVRVPMEAVP